MKESIIRVKSFQFAIRVVNMFKFLIDEKKEYIMSKQLLRCGTSIGANCREGDYAQSKADFIHKLSISQKECNETMYWLELLNATNYIDNLEYKSINTDAVEIMKLLTAIIVTSKKSLNIKH